MEWKPIESAPKDGTRVLLLCFGARIVIGYWRNYWLSSPGDYGIKAETHWMPLPKPMVQEPLL